MHFAHGGGKEKKEPGHCPRILPVGGETGPSLETNEKRREESAAFSGEEGKREGEGGLKLFAGQKKKKWDTCTSGPSTKKKKKSTSS